MKLEPLSRRFDQDGAKDAAHRQGGGYVMFQDGLAPAASVGAEDCQPSAEPYKPDIPGILLLRVGQADDRAFRRLYDLTSPRLLAKAMSICGSRDAAEDALQEAYVRIWHHADRFDPSRGPAGAWLMRIQRNAAIDRLRQDRQVARCQTSDEPLPEIPVAPDPVTDRLDLDRAIAQLPPEQSSTIYRVVVQGWTHEEVAIHDGLPTPTAKARAQRGLRRLRSALTDLSAEPAVSFTSEKAVA